MSVKLLHSVAVKLLLPLFLISCSLPVSKGYVNASRVFQFGDKTYQIENLAVRSNGNILLATSFPAAEVYEINPNIGNSSLKVVANNTQLNGVHFALGLAELYPDVFAVITGTVNQTGTFAVHTIDFNTPAAPTINLTNRIDEATLLNGLVALPNGILLSSDSYIGRILRINTTSGKHSVAFNGTAYEALPGSTGTALLGVNGLRTLGSWLYFINSSRRSLSRVLISTDGHPKGSQQLVANVSSIQVLPDDFALQRDGTAFIAGSDRVVKVTPEGEASILVGGPGAATVAGATSAQFGRSGEENILFVTTGATPHNGVPPGAGFLEALEL